MSNLRIGTSGWNYPAGEGTWNGLFYPTAAKGRRQRGARPKFDELVYYAEHFDTVEVNTTFYGQPKAAVARTWADRTPAGFEFSLKLIRTLTHADISSVPLDLEAIDAYRRGIEPLATTGRIGALLAQFPPSFKQTSESQGYLDRLLQRFREYPIAVELRHRSWSDDFSSTLSLLNAHNAALTQIDEPKFKVSIRQNYLPNVTSFYYMRLHGRNAAQWWKHEKSEDRYNYLYSARELQEFSDVAGAARRLVRKSYLYTNNHYSSKSVVNALMLKAQLGEPIEGEYPPELIEKYPDLEALIDPDKRRSWSNILHEARAVRALLSS
jgi:uncharacterized protein YecE (DUF72 family)